MYDMLLIASRDLKPADKAEIQAALNRVRIDLHFAVLEECPSRGHNLRRDLAYTQWLLTRVRQGMHALLLRHMALRTAAQGYVDEWKDDLPKGWSLDELLQALQLEREIPDDSICIDPDGRDQHREDLEDWVVELAQHVETSDMPKDRDELQRILNAAYRKGNQDAHRTERVVREAGLVPKQEASCL